MLKRNQLRKWNRSDLPLHIVEQDYLQSIFLQELYKITEDLVFKGGTYLKHAHGLDRFSEDLDFTMRNDIDMHHTFNIVTEELSRYGIDAFLDRIKDDDLSFNARLRYRGPLFNGSERSLGHISIEVSKRGDLIKEPKWTRSFFDYPEVSVVNVLGMPLEEVLSEKLRALTMRGKGRDLYDVWYLLKKGIEPDAQLFNKKMISVGMEPDLKIKVDRSEWERDLNTLIRDPPIFEDVIEFVLSGTFVFN